MTTIAYYDTDPSKPARRTAGPRINLTFTEAEGELITRTLIGDRQELKLYPFISVAMGIIILTITPPPKQNKKRAYKLSCQPAKEPRGEASYSISIYKRHLPGMAGLGKPFGETSTTYSLAPGNGNLVVHIPPPTRRMPLGPTSWHKRALGRRQRSLPGII